MPDRIQCVDLAHVHIIVDDIDYASEFYREVLDFVEMQSHDNLANPGLARYYGWFGNVDDFRVSLRFLTWPDALTIKLVKVRIRGIYDGSNAQMPTQFEPRLTAGFSQYFSTGTGALSVRVKDLDATFAHLLAYAQDYTSKYKITLISNPTFLSALKPGDIGATSNSALYQNDVVLEALAKTFDQRSKFQLIDPFGVRWEFNNDIV